MKVLFSTLVMVFILAGIGNACTFTWNPVTTYTDGSSATGVNYKLYFTAAGTTVTQVIADTPLVTIAVLCPAGTYQVTAYSSTAVESAKSNPVVLKQAATPVNLTWTP